MIGDCITGGGYYSGFKTKDVVKSLLTPPPYFRQSPDRPASVTLGKSGPTLQAGLGFRPVEPS